MSTEARLKDALTAVGDSLGPADVPHLRLENHRRVVGSRMAVVAGVGLAAIAAVGTVVMANPFASGRTGAPVATAPSNPLSRPTKVSVFLCLQRSANPNCNHAAATPGQKDAIEATLKKTPGVVNFVYESQTQALARLKSSTHANTAAVQPGDIPDSFRVTFSNPPDAARAQTILRNMPGVDQVFTEPRK